MLDSLNKAIIINLMNSIINAQKEGSSLKKKDNIRQQSIVENTGNSDGYEREVKENRRTFCTAKRCFRFVWSKT